MPVNQILVPGAGVTNPNTQTAGVPGSPTGTSSLPTFASLPSAASAAAGTIQYTSDQGPVYSNGSAWQTFGGGGSSVNLGLFTGGSVIIYNAAAGQSNNVNPGGAWPAATVGRIEVNTSAGNANWTGLAAPTTPAQDGQGVLIKNLRNGGNTLTLNANNAGSSAANKFDLASDIILNAGDSVIAVYEYSRQLWYIAP
jgi:hypothetical protein